MGQNRGWGFGDERFGLFGPPKVIFVAPPLGPSNFGTKLKVIDYILCIHVLPGWQLAR